MISSTADVGKKRFASCTRPIIFRNLPAGFVPRRARRLACWASTQPAVTIKQIEKNIVERGFQEGWIRSRAAKGPHREKRGDRRFGPAGLAAAQQLCRAGHSVTVYEKADRIGGLLRYGIPQFKLEKHLIDRRLEQMSAEGVKFVTGAEVGKNIAVEDLQREFDAIVLAGGAEQPRDLNVPGRELKGIHFAMDFLAQQNHRNLGDTIAPEAEILATGKRVVIIGGGDTGADCLGTSIGKSRCPCTSSKSCPSLPTSARR